MFIFCKKYYKPLLATLLLGVVMFGFGTEAWAAGQCLADKAIDSTSEGTYVMGAVIRLISWFWFIPAVLAGKLMSNDLIYGQIVGLEHYFYQFWTLMRTVANFALIAIIVSIIGKVVFGGGKAGEILGKYGIKIVLSGILINFSWFLMGALVDVSTIMVTGVGQISNNYMSGTLATTTMNLTASIPSQLSIDSCGCVQATSTTGSTLKRDQLTKNHNEIAGPLVFLGAGIMKLQAYNLNVGCSNADYGDFSKLTLKGVLQLGLMVMFVVPLLVLAAFNLFRLIYIWGWIIFSPLIILYNLFEDQAKELGVDGSGFKDAISFSNIIAGLIQPVATVSALTLGTMLVTAMYVTVDYSQTETLDNVVGATQGVINKAGSSSINIGDNGNIGTITLVDKLIDDPSGTIGGGFGYLLLAFVTCFVMWMLVKMSFSLSSKGFKQMFDAQKLMETWNQEFMVRMKIPQGVGGPLGGASLAEAASFMDPTDKNNKIMKKIDEIGGSMKKSGIADANKGLENSRAGSLLGMQDNGDLRDEDSGLVSFNEGATIKDGDYQANLTKTIDGLKASASAQDGKKSFKVDRADRASYKALQKWYDKQGKKAIEAMGIEVDVTKDGQKSKEKLKLGSFDDEFKKSASYVGGLIEYLAKGEKLKINGEKIDTKVKEKRISDIDFKNF